MSDPARYVYFSCMRYLGSDPSLTTTWSSHHTLPLTLPVNPALPRAGRTHRHRHFRATVRRIAALGPMMDPIERRILIRILTFMQAPREAMRGIRFRNSHMLPAIVERCSMEVLYYERLINSALAAANAVQQQEEQRLINHLEIEDMPEENQLPREAANADKHQEEQRFINHLEIEDIPEENQLPREAANADKHQEEPRELNNYLQIEDILEENQLPREAKQQQEEQRELINHLEIEDIPEENQLPREVINRQQEQEEEEEKQQDNLQTLAGEVRTGPNQLQGRDTNKQQQEEGQNNNMTTLVGFQPQQHEEAPFNIMTPLGGFQNLNIENLFFEDAFAIQNGETNFWFEVEDSDERFRRFQQ